MLMQGGGDGKIMTTATLEERLGRIEGTYEHLSTKSDVAHLEARMIRWMVGLVLGGLGAGIGLTTFLVRTLQ